MRLLAWLDNDRRRMASALKALGPKADAVEWSRIPRRLCPDLLEKFRPEDSLYDTLLQHYGIRMSVAEEVVEAGLATAQVARLLKAPKTSPMFMFTRTSYAQNGEPVEFVKSVYRGDRYKIVNRLTRVNGKLLGIEGRTRG